MIRFWFEFEDTSIPTGTLMGCGVTAYDFHDAISIVQNKIFGNNLLPRIKSVVENIDVSTLDSGHVQPNILPTIVRGIWFPVGYQ